VVRGGDIRMTTFEAQARAQVAEISALGIKVEDFLQSAGVDARARYHVAMLLEELMSNLGSHGGAPEAPANVRIAVDPASVRVELRDHGAPFDPRSAPQPDLSTRIEERQIGGLGLLLLRKFARDIAYERSGAQNRTQFSVPRAP
jgi:anti-sigma regulatory factor (Ser/Thr protein kinase)